MKTAIFDTLLDPARIERNVADEPQNQRKYDCDEARLSPEEIAEIYRNMEARGLTHVFCQACSEEMKPEQARKSSTGLIMCRPCYMCNDTDATQEEIDQALEEDFPGYLASFKRR
jgi:formylmethanofuran dehydrogenase subunit E